MDKNEVSKPRTRIRNRKAYFAKINANHTAKLNQELIREALEARRLKAEKEAGKRPNKKATEDVTPESTQETTQEPTVTPGFGRQDSDELHLRRWLIRDQARRKYAKSRSQSIAAALHGTESAFASMKDNEGQQFKLMGIEKTQ